MSDDRIVAVGLLTARDLDVLGTGFRRLLPVADGADFADLIRALDGVDMAGTPDARAVACASGRRGAR